MEIVKLHRQNLEDVNRANQPFEVIGRILPALSHGQWTYTEELFERAHRKRYPDCDFDPDGYVDSPDRAAFLAYSHAECVGQIVLKRDWNEYALIEDICVAEAFRGQGIGTALVRRAVEWAQSAGLKGLVLETQDDNLLACRFYARRGFAIGAVNTMLYKNFGSEEYAVFWYMRFEDRPLF